MEKDLKKSKFVGIRMTWEQEDLLLRLQDCFGNKSRTDVLLNGLQFLDERFPIRTSEVTSAKVKLINPSSLSQEVQKEQEVMSKVVMMMSEVDKILDKYQRAERFLIQILLEIQKRYNWLPKEALLWLSIQLGIPLNRIYQIASFYKAFSLIPRGRHLIKVCMGTACHVRGAMTLLARTEQFLGIKSGETSKDLRFSLERVNCLGCCALGPVIMIDEEYLSNPSTSQLEKILTSLQ